MPSLESLIVSGPGAPAILTTLTAFSTLSITSLTFDENVCTKESVLRSFCSLHGACISTVTNRGQLDMLSTLLPTCPALTLLSVTNVNLATLAKAVRRLKSSHASLAEIIIRHLSRVGERYTKTKVQEDEMRRLTNFCESINTATFPALRTLRVPQYNLWPETQRDIANHPLPVLAEKMLERGVRIVDNSGRGWKPRLTRAKMK